MDDNYVITTKALESNLNKNSNNINDNRKEINGDGKEDIFTVQSKSGDGIKSIKINNIEYADEINHIIKTVGNSFYLLSTDEYEYNDWEVNKKHNIKIFAFNIENYDEGQKVALFTYEDGTLIWSNTLTENVDKYSFYEYGYIVNENTKDVDFDSYRLEKRTDQFIGGIEGDASAGAMRDVYLSMVKGGTIYEEKNLESKKTIIPNDCSHSLYVREIGGDGWLKVSIETWNKKYVSEEWNCNQVWIYFPNQKIEYKKGVF